MITKTLLWSLFFLEIFILLAIAVFYYSQELWIDQKVLYILHDTSTPFLDKFAISFTDVAIYWGTVPVVLLLSLVLAYRQQWRHLLYVSLTGLGSIALSYGTKNVFSRVRPHFWESTYAWPNSFSFPSGHALSSMILVMILVTVSWHSKWRKFIIALGIIFVSFIGWTRMYLGVHYPSDILGGWSLAIAWSLLVQEVILSITKNRNTILKNE